MPPDPTATAPSDRKVGFSVETIDIRLIRIFMAVVEAGGLSAAQLELNLALSTISEKVSALEKRFGMKLCQRGRSGFELTTAGEQFYEECDRLLKALDQFGQRVGTLNAKMPRNLTIGLVDNMISDPRCPMSHALGQFTRQAPGVHLRLVALTPNELLAEVLARRVDMVVGSFPKVILGLDYIDLYEEPHHFYCSEAHPLFDVPETEVGIDTVRDHRIVARSYWGARDTRIFAIPSAHATVSDMEAEAHLILSGAFLGYLPEHMADVLSRRVKLRPLRRDLFSYSARFQIALRENWRSHAAQRLMVDSILEGLGDRAGSAPVPDRIADGRYR
ncbi:MULTISPECIES: LysR family transcriptional regulator [Salipiger]|nr:MULTISPECIES: LysR family transcriptional regulator [Salipiger]GGA20052.1 protein GbuR [Salipiger profundus]SFD39175.1 DNA-binding transcriptional regulator, LysR family [Salipiger profundus]